MCICWKLGAAPAIEKDMVTPLLKAFLDAGDKEIM
jgi:hypothetical protein